MQRTLCTLAQHTQNIHTNTQALLANIAALYGVYHGPKGLVEIADRVHGLAATFAAGARKLGLKVTDAPFFDTVAVGVADADKVVATALKHQVRAAAVCSGGGGGRCLQHAFVVGCCWLLSPPPARAPRAALEHSPLGPLLCTLYCPR